jgi:hypothetical protein
MILLSDSVQVTVIHRIEVHLWLCMNKTDTAANELLIVWTAYSKVLLMSFATLVVLSCHIV